MKDLRKQKCTEYEEVVFTREQMARGKAVLNITQGTGKNCLLKNAELFSYSLRESTER